jgi:ketosteroid isomerase-like protein
MDTDRNIATVRAYFDACNSGDLTQLMATLQPDVTHYFLAERFAPVHGAEHLAKLWRKFHTQLKPTWRVDHIIGQGDSVAIEWSCAFDSQRSGKRVMMRGSEWYTLREGKIAEIRAYFIDDESKDTELIGFPYHERDFLRH